MASVRAVYAALVTIALLACLMACGSEEKPLRRPNCQWYNRFTEVTRPFFKGFRGFTRLNVMAIEIRIESSWQTDDGEGRTIEVSTLERDHPGEDPAEDSRWFAGGDLDALKRYLTELVDRKASRFLGRENRECTRCSRI